MLISFDAAFPAIARRETRSLVVEVVPEVPSGTYSFHEYHCVDPRCDCRTVALVVRSRNKTVATIALWLDDPNQAFLDPEDEQSDFAKPLLEFLLDRTRDDRSFVAMLERHYEMMKTAHGQAPQPIERTVAKAGRNDKCPCGSGKKFKKCCLGTEAEGTDAGLPMSIATFTRHAAEEAFDDDDDDLDDEDLDDGALYEKEPFDLIADAAPTPFWSLDVDEILERVRERGLELSRERFREEARGESAWSLAVAWTRLVDHDDSDEPDDELFLAACELWRRLGADRPFDDLLDDRVAEGYVLARRGQRQRALEYWNSTWQTVKARWSTATRTLDAASEALGLPSLQDWLCDFVEDLRDEALADARVAAIAAEIVREILAAVPDEDAEIRFEYRVDLGDFLLLAGRAEEGTALLLELIRERPTKSRPYVCLVEDLARRGETARALDVLDAPALREGVAGKAARNLIDSLRARLRAETASPSSVRSEPETAR